MNILLLLFWGHKGSTKNFCDFAQVSILLLRGNNYKIILILYIAASRVPTKKLIDIKVRKLSIFALKCNLRGQNRLNRVDSQCLKYVLGIYNLIYMFNYIHGFCGKKQKRDLGKTQSLQCCYHCSTAKHFKNFSIEHNFLCILQNLILLQGGSGFIVHIVEIQFSTNFDPDCYLNIVVQFCNG